MINMLLTTETIEIIKTTDNYFLYELLPVILSGLISLIIALIVFYIGSQKEKRSQILRDIILPLKTGLSSNDFGKIQSIYNSSSMLLLDKKYIKALECYLMYHQKINNKMSKIIFLDTVKSYFFKIINEKEKVVIDRENIYIEPNEIGIDCNVFNDFMENLESDFIDSKKDKNKDKLNEIYKILYKWCFNNKECSYDFVNDFDDLINFGKNQKVYLEYIDHKKSYIDSSNLLLELIKKYIK